jgi:hypothetical protein
MKSFYEYLSAVKKEYNYRLKFAHLLDDEALDKIEKILSHYDVIEISKPKKSILCRDHIDFPDMGPIESYTISIVSERPISPPSLINDLKTCLNVTDRAIKVRNANDDLAVADRFAEEMANVDEVSGDNLVATNIGTLEIPEENEVAYGDDYNQKLLSYLAQIQSTKAEEFEKATGHKSMFDWLDVDTATDDAQYNNDIKTLKPISGKNFKSKELEFPANVAPTGNYDSRIKHASKTIVKSGKLVKIEGDSK